MLLISQLELVKAIGIIKSDGCGYTVRVRKSVKIMPIYFSLAISSRNYNNIRTFRTIVITTDRAHTPYIY